MIKSWSTRNEDAVSEVVGFILILGIMMAGIALVTLYGYPALLEAQSNANTRNMERNMIIIQNDMKSLTYKSVPYKETSIQVSGGTLSLRNPDLTPAFNVEIVGGPTITPFYPGELHYYSMDDQSVISLENGGVHKNYWSDPQQGSAMIADPRWYYDDSIISDPTFVINMIAVHGVDEFASTGIANVQMKVISATQDAPYNTDGKTVRIEYNPDNENNYYKAWENYFDTPSLKMHKLTSSPALVEYTLDNTVKKLIIKRYDIEIIGF
jgi:hypothetical protein